MEWLLQAKKMSELAFLSISFVYACCMPMPAFTIPKTHPTINVYPEKWESGLNACMWTLSMYIYIYIHTYIHTYTYIHTWTYIYTYTYIYIHTYTYINTYIYTYTYIYIYTYRHTYIHGHTYIYTYRHIYIYMDIHIYIYTILYIYIYIHLCIILVHIYPRPVYYYSPSPTLCVAHWPHAHPWNGVCHSRPFSLSQCKKDWLTRAFTVFFINVSYYFVLRIFFSIPDSRAFHRRSTAERRQLLLLLITLMVGYNIYILC